MLFFIPERWIQGFKAQEVQGQLMLNEVQAPTFPISEFCKATEIMTDYLG